MRKGKYRNYREKSRLPTEKKKEKLDLSPKGLENFTILSGKTIAHIESTMGIGMDENDEISLDWYIDAGYYTEEEVRPDREEVARLNKIFARNDAEKSSEQKKMDKIAEIFEKAVPVIFHYAPKAKKLFAVPTAQPTDVLDKIDTFILDEGGQVICAIDETNSNRDNIIQGKKLDNAVQRNQKEEEKVIKYGLALNQEDKKWYPSELKQEDAPLIYLSLPRDDIVQFIDDLAKTDVEYDEDIELLCDNLFEKLTNSLYQSLYHVMTNMPEKQGREKMNNLINLLQQKTGIDPNLSSILPPKQNKVNR